VVQIMIDTQDRAEAHGAAEPSRDVDPVQVEHCVRVLAG
jgi:hypothetical protein